MQIEDKLYKVYVDSSYDIKELKRYIKQETDYTTYNKLEGEVSGEKANILVDRWLREGKQVFKNDFKEKQLSNSMNYMKDIFIHNGWEGTITYKIPDDAKKEEFGSAKENIDREKELDSWDTTQEEFKKAFEGTIKMAEGNPCGYAVGHGSKIIGYDIDKEQGRKDNSTKLPMSILFKQFPRALQAVILASSYGHNVYMDVDSDYLNFSRVKEGSKAYHDADIRHQLDKEIYGENDNESGLPHIFHETFDKLAKCELWIKENDIDIKEFSKNYLEKLQDKK